MMSNVSEDLLTCIHEFETTYCPQRTEMTPVNLGALQRVIDLPGQVWKTLEVHSNNAVGDKSNIGLFASQIKTNYNDANAIESALQLAIRTLKAGSSKTEGVIANSGEYSIFRHNAPMDRGGRFEIMKSNEKINLRLGLNDEFIRDYGGQGGYMMEPKPGNPSEYQLSDTSMYVDFFKTSTSVCFNLNINCEASLLQPPCQMLESRVCAQGQQIDAEEKKDLLGFATFEKSKFLMGELNSSGPKLRSSRVIPFPNPDYLSSFEDLEQINFENNNARLQLLNYYRTYVSGGIGVRAWTLDSWKTFVDNVMQAGRSPEMLELLRLPAYENTQKGLDDLEIKRIYIKEIRAESEMFVSNFTVQYTADGPYRDLFDIFAVPVGSGECTSTENIPNFICKQDKDGNMFAFANRSAWGYQKCFGEPFYLQQLFPKIAKRMLADQKRGEYTIDASVAHAVRVWQSRKSNPPVKDGMKKWFSKWIGKPVSQMLGKNPTPGEMNFPTRELPPQALSTKVNPSVVEAAFVTSYSPPLPVRPIAIGVDPNVAGDVRAALPAPDLKQFGKFDRDVIDIKLDHASRVIVNVTYAPSTVGAAADSAS